MEVVAVVPDVVRRVGSSSRYWCCEETTSSSADGVLGVLASPPTGIVWDSSRDCCDDDTMSPSGEASGMADVSFLAKVTRGSCCEGGAVGLYSDPQSDSVISGAPSIELRRDWVPLPALLRDLYLLVAVAVPPELSPPTCPVGSEERRTTAE